MEFWRAIGGRGFEEPVEDVGSGAETFTRLLVRANGVAERLDGSGASGGIAESAGVRGGCELPREGRWVGELGSHRGMIPNNVRNKKALFGF